MQLASSAIPSQLSFLSLQSHKVKAEKNPVYKLQDNGRDPAVFVKDVKQHIVSEAMKPLLGPLWGLVLPCLSMPLRSIMKAV